MKCPAVFLKSSQIRKLDELATSRYGIPSLILMENAGVACVDEILKRFKLQKNSKVLVFCGPGNNGGDGFVIARHLFNKGFEPIVFYFQSEADMKPDSQTNFTIVKKLGIKTIKITQISQKLFEKYTKGAKLIVDSIFGIGLSKPVRSPYLEAIQWINHARIPVAAIDVPSGLNADSGKIMGECVKADVTVTLGSPKMGFRKKSAWAYLGQWVTRDISLPPQLFWTNRQFPINIIGE